MSQTLDLSYPKKVTRNGQESTIWIKCGILVNKDDGKQAVKIDSIPIGVVGDFWLSATEQRPKN